MQIRKIATEPLYHSICKVVNAPQPLTEHLSESRLKDDSASPAHEFRTPLFSQTGQPGEPLLTNPVGEYYECGKRAVFDSIG
jgi:hypothetical protein